VRASVPSEQAQAVVAIRAATRRPEVLHAIPESQAAYLRLARRGERVPDVGTDVGRRRTVVLQTDGVHVLFGQEAGITCVWRAGAFGCFISGD
jgi:hypothetical protein